MKEKHVLDELSAYIDGEAAHPDRIARHLRHCAACARRHMELLKVSAHVAALPAPPENPDFLGRVLAEIGRAEPARPRRLAFPARRWVPLAAAAALALAAGIAWVALPAGPAAVETAAAPSAAEEALVVTLAGLIAEGRDLGVFDTDAAPSIEVPGPVEEMTVDGFLLAMAALASEEADAPLFAGDVFSEVEAMAEAESLIFNQLLGEYFNEG